MSFKDIPSDQAASFKQKRAVAIKIANADQNLFPELDRYVLAKRIQGAIWGLEKKTKMPITHGEIQELFKKPILPKKVRQEMEDYTSVKERFTATPNKAEQKDPKEIPKGTKLEDLF